MNVIDMTNRGRRRPQSSVRVRWLVERVEETSLIFGIGVVTSPNLMAGWITVTKAPLGQANVRHEMAGQSPKHAQLAGDVLDLVDYDLAFIVWLGRELGLDSPTDPLFVIGFQLEASAFVEVAYDALATFGDAQSPLIMTAGSRAAEAIGAKQWKDVCVAARPR